MVCGQGGFHFGLVLRAVVEHLVLLAHQVADLCKQLFRGQPLQCRVGERGAADEIAAVDHVTLERSEATALVELGVGAALYHVALEVLQDLLVGLRPGDQPFDDLHRLAHVLTQARYLIQLWLAPALRPNEQAMAYISDAICSALILSVPR